MVLPFQITLITLGIVAIAATLLGPRYGWKRLKAFFAAALLGVIAFVPSCVCVKFVVDPFRFGMFSYDSFDEISDFRVARWMPPYAREIDVLKHTGGNGYRARYSISSEDFHTHLEDLWRRYGKVSAVPRHALSDEGKEPSPDDYGLFTELGWQPLKNATCYHSPSEDDGGGATYYFDEDAGLCYERTGYW